MGGAYSPCHVDGSDPHVGEVVRRYANTEEGKSGLRFIPMLEGVPVKTERPALSQQPRVFFCSSRTLSQTPHNAGVQLTCPAMAIVYTRSSSCFVCMYTLSPAL